MEWPDGAHEESMRIGVHRGLDGGDACNTIAVPGRTLEIGLTASVHFLAVRFFVVLHGAVGSVR